MGKFWLILTILFCLSACSGEQCIEADDFGFANFTVSARYSKAEMSNQSGLDQVAPWKSSNYRVNGRPLTILVRGWEPGVDRNKGSELSAWCAWYGQTDNKDTLSTFCERLQDCAFDGAMCTKSKDAKIHNAPCIFRRGIGLYALIVKTGTDPNQSFATERKPDGLTFHLGEPTIGYEMRDVDRSGKVRTAGGLVYKYENSDDLKRQYSDGSLYFKILDKFYDDNSGQYRISIKSGITDTSPDPITYVTKLVKTFLFGVNNDYGLIRNIYTGVVKNPGYRMAVSGILSLYIIWTALSYLVGNVQLTQTELIVRVIKVAIVSALLSSEYSWTFFNDYLFVWFIGGVEQILQMIMEAGATGPGSSSIFALMIAPQTLSKLFSLLFIDWLGFIYITLFLFALYFVMIIFFDAAVIYLTALISIGMIIIMGPIFICFMLFGITKSLFENWLKQLISYAIQPIILFTGLVFISMILRQEIYASLGFRVCKQSFPEMNNDGGDVISDATRDATGINLGSSIFYWWFPNPMKGEQFSKAPEGLVNIPIPVDHYVSKEDAADGNGNEGEFCEAYGCIGKRFIDLPFLDPVNDKKRLDDFKSGKFVQLDGLLIIFVAIYLLNKFNGLAVSIAKFITGTSGNLTDIKKVSDSTSGAMRKGFDAIGGNIKGRLAKTAVGRRVTQLREKVNETVKEVKKMPSKWVDKQRISGLKKDALSKKPNLAVAQEARKLSGLDPSTLKPGAIDDYKKALKEEIKDIDKSLTDKMAGKIADQMSNKSFKDLEKEFAKAKYGKEHAALSEAEKSEIKKIMGNHSFRELANNAEASRRYQEAYVDAYAALSQRGVGLVGKRNVAIRSLEEIKHRADTKEQLKLDKRRQTGEQLYAGYENLKHDAYAKATGGSKDRFGHTFAGGSYNTIDTNPEAENYRMQTYNEILAEREKDLKYRPIAKKIADLSSAKNDNVTSPEFIARARITGDSNLSIYEELEREEIKHVIYEKLAGTKEPALKGDLFMREYAKDSEMIQMIDKAKDAREEMLKDDNFVFDSKNREEHYEYRLELAEKDILKKMKDVAVDSGQDLALSYQQHLQEHDKTPAEIMQEVRALQASIDEFNSSQLVLQEIDHRKQLITEEFDRHIAGINEYRKKAGMHEYTPPKTQVGTRSERKIEDLRRK